jgi:hypothetical protein
MSSRLAGQACVARLTFGPDGALADGLILISVGRANRSTRLDAEVELD